MNESLAGLSGPEKRELLARLLKQKLESQEASGASEDGPREFPLSAGQQGLWYAYRRDPAMTAYNVHLPTRVRSPINLEAMEQAIEELVRRHAALRTQFSESSSTHQPIQRVQPSLPPEFRIIDMPGMADSQLRELVLQEIARPFDLTSGPLLRLALFRIADDDTVVVATTHHIVVDFWSLILIMDEVRTLYAAYAAGEDPQLAPAPSNYEDFVRFQSESLGNGRSAAAAEYWKHELAEVRPTIDWVTDFQRPAKFTHRASTLPLEFSPLVAERIQALARRLNVTGNVIIMACLQAFVARFNRQDSFSIGTPYSGRSQREFENTVGFFVNLLPIVADLAGNPTLVDLVEAVGRRMVGALDHESLPFSEIVRNSGVSRDPGRNPLFQVSCTFEKSHLQAERGRASFLFANESVFEDFAGLRQESFHVGIPTCLYDLEFVFDSGEDRLGGMICYCRDLFAPDTIESMAEQCVALFESLVANPDAAVKELPWRISVRQTQTGGGKSKETLADFFAESEHEIVRRAKRFAGQLLRQGVKPTSIVPVCLNRGPEAWVGILGVMFAGSTPVLIDADQVAIAPELLRQDAEISFVVAGPNDFWAKQLGVPILSVDSGEDIAGPGVQICRPDDLAYVIYTSGSTGKPKGVMIRHDAITNTMRSQVSLTPLAENDRVLVLLSHQFDAAMALVFAALHHNATLVWPDQMRQLDLDRIIDQIIAQRVTVVQTVASFLKVLAQHPRFEQCTSIRQIWTGGESFSAELPTLIRSKLDCEIWNFYGPTEAAIQVTAHKIEHADPRRRIPIGTEIDGVRIDIVDEHLAPLPVGVAGQIVISGRGLADGYLNRQDLTDQAFVPCDKILDPAGNPLRVYLTGDLGRRRGDGNIEFLSRMDHQVKVRGYRLELEEIERALEQTPGVERAAVKVIHQGTAAEQLAGFVSGNQSLRTESIAQHLCTRLPEFKRPTSITIVDPMPIGTSGKVDRSRLPDPDESQAGIAGSVRPRSEMELFFAQRFAAALGRTSVGIDENFFEAGGTSLQAAILTAELSAELELSIPTSLLFDLGNVRLVAQRLVALHETQMRDRFGEDSIQVATTGLVADDSDPLLAELKPSGSKPPVFMIHPPGGIVVCYHELAASISQDQPLVAIRSRGLHGDEPLPETLAEMAGQYAASIRKRQAVGPYIIGGWSLGGVIAYEVARQLVQQGCQVAGLVLLDSTVPEHCDTATESAGMEYGLDLSLEQLGELSVDEQLPYLYQHAERLGVLDDDTPKQVVENVIADLRRLFAHHVQLCQGVQLQPLDVPVLLIRPSEIPVAGDTRPDRGWGRWTKQVTVCTVPGHHHSMVQSPGAAEMAQHMDRFVEQCTASQS